MADLIIVSSDTLQTKNNSTKSKSSGGLSKVDNYTKLNSEESLSERYRFIYPSIEIPGEIVVKTYLTTMGSLDHSQLIAVIILAIVGLIIFSYLLTRKILPALGILKNRYFVEENDAQISNENNIQS